MIPDGATIMYGGFLGCGSAHHIIEALAQKGTKDLTIIGNDCGMATGPNGEEFYGVAKLVHNHQVKHVIATHVGMTPDVGTQGMVDKTLTVDLIPQGTLAEMIRAGGAGLGGGHDEREQTLNQLLVEMDGFGNNEGVVVMAATNRQDILDPALLRPGRFDRQVYVGHPDIKGREAILKVHARNKPLGDDVSLAELAKGTGGFTGADLENLMNEAALLAARRHHRFISMAELNEAVIKVIAGPEKKITAYHEAGHAIVIHDLPTQDPVHEITIIPRGMAGGMTISLPQEDVTFQTRQQLTERIAVCLGGRAAEQLALGDISTGAGNDLQKASAIARNMVTRYGMSEKVGNVVFDSGHDEVFIGRSMAQTKNYSEEVAALIDEEVKALVDGAYARCGEILTHRRRELDIVAEYLLQYENMDAKTFEQVFTDPAALQPPAAYQAVEAEAEQDAREEEEHGVD